MDVVSPKREAGERDGGVESVICVVWYLARLESLRNSIISSLFPLFPKLFFAKLNFQLPNRM